MNTLVKAIAISTETNKALHRIAPPISSYEHSSETCFTCYAVQCFVCLSGYGNGFMNWWGIDKKPALCYGSQYRKLRQLTDRKLLALFVHIEYSIWGIFVHIFNGFKHKHSVIMFVTHVLCVSVDRLPWFYNTSLLIHKQHYHKSSHKSNPFRQELKVGWGSRNWKLRILTNNC